MFSLDDIVFLSDEDLRKVILASDAQSLIAAFSTCDSDVRDKLSRSLSETEALQFKQDMEKLKPVSPDYSEKTRNEIVSVIRHLEQIGEITVLKI